MATAAYDEALRRLLAHEGGYSNHPADPGGPTNFGITIADFRKYVKPGASAADLKAMSLAEAKAIYRAKYWNALRCDDLPAGVDYAVFDYGVNSGVARAAKVLRRIVGAGGDAASVDAVAVALVRGRDARQLVVALCEERLAFLKRLKTWPVFGRGWSRRVAEVKTAALAMAAAETGATPISPHPTVAARAGKGVVPFNTTAQRGTIGGVVTTGGAAAQQAHQAGASPTLVAVIVFATLALAIAAWLFWRWRQKRQQEATTAVAAASMRTAARPAPATALPEP
jgi:lysozyme family protein